MQQLKDLQAERDYTAQVQRLLIALIEQAQVMSGEHLESIQAIVSEAWKELRERPTALSQQELDQLATEVDRFAARK